MLCPSWFNKTVAFGYNRSSSSYKVGGRGKVDLSKTWSLQKISKFFIFRGKGKVDIWWAIGGKIEIFAKAASA